MTADNSWGWSCHLDCANANLEKINDVPHMKNFLQTLVKRIDMKAFGDPIVVCFGEENSNKFGYSGFQLIETSNITFHACNSTGEIYVCVFSCKPYDPENVKLCVEDFFGCDRIRMRCLSRQA